MPKVAILAAVVTISNGQAAVNGQFQLSVLGSPDGVGSACEYANGADGGRKSPAATSPHLVSGRYCGVSADMFKGGAGCGGCFNLSYSGEGGTNPGRAGWEIVQAVDLTKGNQEEFACSKSVFESITGATTGSFPIYAKPYYCELGSPKGVATVLTGSNAYYTKAIFSDLKCEVETAELKVGSKSFPMERVAGATWKANTDGTSGSAYFRVTVCDSSVHYIGQISAPCFKSWPVATGSFCAPTADALGCSTSCDCGCWKSVPQPQYEGFTFNPVTTDDGFGECACRREGGRFLVGCCNSEINV